MFFYGRQTLVTMISNYVFQLGSFFVLFVFFVFCFNFHPLLLYVCLNTKINGWLFSNQETKERKGSSCVAFAKGSTNCSLPENVTAWKARHEKGWPAQTQMSVKVLLRSCLLNCVESVLFVQLDVKSAH